MTLQFVDMCYRQIFLMLPSFSCKVLLLVKFYYYMSISLMVLEWWQFLFIRDWPEIWKTEIPSPKFFAISEYLGKLGIPNLAWMYLMKRYWILQNARVTAFTVSELLRGNKQGVKLPPSPPSLELRWFSRFFQSSTVSQNFVTW